MRCSVWRRWATDSARQEFSVQEHSPDSAAALNITRAPMYQRARQELLAREAALGLPLEVLRALMLLADQRVEAEWKARAPDMANTATTTAAASARRA